MLVLMPIACFPLPAMPESGYRREWVMAMRTLRPTRQQTAGDVMERIPTISDQMDFLTITDDNSHERHQLLIKVEICSFAYLASSGTFTLMWKLKC